MIIQITVIIRPEIKIKRSLEIIRKSIQTLSIFRHKHSRKFVFMKKRFKELNKRKRMSSSYISARQCKLADAVIDMIES